MISTLAIIESENQDLAVHTELCAARYQALDDRLGKVESKVDEIHKTVESLHGDLWRVLIGTAGSVLVAVITTLGVIYVHMK